LVHNQDNNAQKNAAAGHERQRAKVPGHGKLAPAMSPIARREALEVKPCFGVMWPLCDSLKAPGYWLEASRSDRQINVVEESAGA
jgi:hypothetical protein